VHTCAPELGEGSCDDSEARIGGDELRRPLPSYYLQTVMIRPECGGDVAPHSGAPMHINVRVSVLCWPLMRVIAAAGDNRK
jgi:hypothetical protein